MHLRFLGQDQYFLNLFVVIERVSEGKWNYWMIYELTKFISNASVQIFH